MNRAVPVRRGQALVTLALLCLVNAFAYVDRAMLALTMPAISAELRLSDTVMGLLAGLPFALCYALCAIPLAWIADTRNRRTLLALALTFWSGVTLATGTVQSGWQLAAARFGLGAGEAAGHPASASLIGDLFGLRTRSAAFAALSASAYLGPLLGFPLIGWLMAQWGWRFAFLTMGAAGIAAALGFFLVVREPPRIAQEPKVERRQFSAAVVRLLRIRSYVLVVLAGGFNAINQGAHLTWGPTFLARVHGLKADEIGLWFGTLRGAAGLGGALLAATLIASAVRRDLRWQIRAALLVAPLPFLSDAMFLFAPSPLLWQLGLGLTAFFTAIVVAVSYPLYVNVVPGNLRATASAFYFLVATLMGFVLGPFCVGALNDLLAPRLGTAAIAGSMIAVSSAALVAAGLLLAAKRHWIGDVDQAPGQ